MEVLRHLENHHVPDMAFASIVYQHYNLPLVNKDQPFQPVG